LLKAQGAIRHWKKEIRTFGEQIQRFRVETARRETQADMWNLDGLDRTGAIYAIDQALEEMTKRYADASAAASADAFEAGRKLAYYEMLDILRSRLMVFGGEMDEIDPPKCTGSIRK